MGFFSSALLQAAVAAVLLGALKRAGIVSVHPNAIEDENVRNVFVNAVDLGEAVAKKGSSIIDTLKGK